MSKYLHGTFITLLLGCVLVTGVPGFVSSVEAQFTSDEKLKGGERAPSFLVEDIEGTMKALASYRGHYILLHFWAPWNEGTDDELEALKKVLKQVGDPEHFIVVTVARGTSKEDVLAMVKKHDIWFPVLLDPQSKVRKMYYVKELPQTLLIDPNGQLVNFPDPESGLPVVRVIGVRDWGSESAVGYFKGLVAGMQPEEG